MIEPIYVLGGILLIISLLALYNDYRLNKIIDSYRVEIEYKNKSIDRIDKKRLHELAIHLYEKAPLGSKYSFEDALHNAEYLIKKDK